MAFGDAAGVPSAVASSSSGRGPSPLLGAPYFPPLDRALPVPAPGHHPIPPTARARRDTEPDEPVFVARDLRGAVQKKTGLESFFDIRSLDSATNSAGAQQFLGQSEARAHLLGLANVSEGA